MSTDQAVAFSRRTGALRACRKCRAERWVDQHCPICLDPPEMDTATLNALREARGEFTRCPVHDELVPDYRGCFDCAREQATDDENGQ